jgi:hypothetical protein
MAEFKVGYIGHIGSATISVASSGEPSKITCICCAELELALERTQTELRSTQKIVELLREEIYRFESEVMNLMNGTIGGNGKDSGSVELTSVLLMTLVSSFSGEQENHEVSIHKNWIEVNSKHRSNLYSCRKRNSVPVIQPILTSNRYAQLSNLQNSTVNANDAKVPSELGLLNDLQSANGQSELINEEEKSDHHIPVILNGKLRSKAVNKSVNCANKRNPRLVNKVSVNNLPSTGNIGLQTPNKNKSSVTILSDSHLKGCTKGINVFE